MSKRIDWNLRMVKARKGIKLLPRVPGNLSQVDWGSLRVGHLDTGYTEHPVFGDWSSGSTWLRPDHGLNLREEGSRPLDPLNYEGNPGHGTRTSSVLCGEPKPPLEYGQAKSGIGVAPRLPVIPCRVVNRVVLTPERNRRAVADGIVHCAERACQVISISLGTPFFLPGTGGRLGRTIDRAYEAGIIIVAAAGQVINSVTYPGKYHRTIGVGGVNRQRRIWFKYDAGRERLDVWAPADDVLRTNSIAAEGVSTADPIEADDPGAWSLSSGSHSGKPDFGSGTSYATVHVAAAAAMWLRLRGDDVKAKYQEPWQWVEAFRLLLKQTAQRINGEQPGNGTGILDIEALLTSRLPPASQLRKAPAGRGAWG